MLGLLNDKDTAALRQQAYLAARAELGTQGRAGTADNIIVSKIAEGYVKAARARLPGVISAKQIQADPEFQALVGKGGAAGGWGLQDQFIDGVPNYVLYGGAGLLGALVFWPRGKKKVSSKRKKSKTSRVSVTKTTLRAVR